MKTKALWSANALVLSILLGCGGSSIPVAKVVDSESTIRAAEEAGAEQIPQAQLHLKMARDHQAKAQALIKEEENERAALFLNRAEADAQVALALAHEGSERTATLAAQARLQQLQQPGMTTPPAMPPATQPSPATAPIPVR